MEPNSRTLQVGFRHWIEKFSPFPFSSFMRLCDLLVDEWTALGLLRAEERMQNLVKEILFAPKLHLIGGKLRNMNEPNGGSEEGTGKGIGRKGQRESTATSQERKLREMKNFMLKYF